MTTLIRVRGWITESRVILPIRSYVEEQDIYTLSLQAESPTIFTNIEQQVTQIRDARKEAYKLDDTLTTYVQNRDKLYDGCEV